MDIQVTEAVNSTWTNKISKSAYERHLIAKASGQPINPGDVYISPALTDMSVGFMMDQNTVSGRMCPSVKVAKQSGAYPNFPRSYWLRDEMAERTDGQPSPTGTMAITWPTFSVPVYSWKIPLGAQARANASPLQLDKIATMIAANKATLKREILWFSKFFKTGVWTTQVQHKTSGGGGVAGVDLSFKDANALPVKQIKAALDTQSGLTGDLYRANRAVFSKDVWTAFTEHPNVLNRVNNGQTPGAPADVTTNMVAGWLGLKEVIVAGGVQTTSAEGVAEASATYARIATGGQLLLAYVPDAPDLITPSAMYSFDWVPEDSMVGGYGNAVASWWDQDRKAQMYEVEMATAPAVISADCGLLLYNLLA